MTKADSIADLNSESITSRSVLGHTRLAIVGGTCGVQPLRSCDGRFTLEHNSERYNYKANSQLSGQRGHDFQTRTDSEIVVHIIEENLKGRDLFEAVRRTVATLDGVYPLAIRDEVTGETVPVRDRKGVRQLYYAEEGRFLAFASERHSGR